MNADPNSRAEQLRAGTREDTLVHLWLRAVKRAPDADALVMPGLRWTYKTLFGRATTTMGALRTAGLGHGDRIGIFMHDSPQYLELVVACVLLGAVPVLFNVSGDPLHHDRLIHELDLKVVFASRTSAENLATRLAQRLATRAHDDGRAIPVIEINLESELGDSSYVRVLGGCMAFTDQELREQVARIRPDDTLVILFTSATSNEAPATCLLSNRDIISKAGPLIERLGMGPGSRIWIPLHMFQVGFFSPWVAAVACGAATIASQQFEIASVLALIKQEKITHAYPIYPSYWLPLIYHTDFFPSEFPALTHVVLLGPESLLRRVQRAVPHASLMNNYGGAEVGGTICLPMDTDPAEIRLGTVGYPYDNLGLRIVDPQDGHPCGPGAVGEIQVWQPGEHQASLGPPGGPPPYTADGWLRTSDLGSLTPKGALMFHGRLSDLLSVEGKKVSAVSIESILSEHPAVSVAQVIGIDDPVTGKAPVAFVELRPGYFTDADELLEHCSQRLTPAEVPRRVLFVTDWPTSASKIQKARLYQLLDQPATADAPSD